MADVSSDLKNWSTTAASNNPTDSTVISSGLADNFQQLQATVRQDLASKGADIASASTTDLGAVPGLFHDITGTTSITSFGTVAAGIWKVIKFENTLTLTHNATSLILPTGANITTANGDVAIVSSEGSGNWRCHSYMRASGQPIATAVSVASLATSGNVTVGGTLAASGNANITGTLASNGNMTVTGTATMNGAVTVNNSAFTHTASSVQHSVISTSGNMNCTYDATGQAIFSLQATGNVTNSLNAGDSTSVVLESFNGDAAITFQGPVVFWALGRDYSVSGEPFKLSASATLGTNDVFIADQSKNFVIGSAQLANSATDGFLYIPGTTSGMPTGIPTAYSGRHPIVVDDTNNRLCVNIGGTWRYAALT